MEIYSFEKYFLLDNFTAQISCSLINLHLRIKIIGKKRTEKNLPGVY